MMALLAMACTANVKAQYNLALDKIATASSVWSKTVAENAVDGNWKTYWCAATPSAKNPTNTNSWLQVDLDKPVEFCRIVIKERGKRITKYSLEASDDATNWQEVVPPTDRVIDEQTKNNIEASFKAVSKRYVRIKVLATRDNNGKPYAPCINEFEVYAE